MLEYVSSQVLPQDSNGALLSKVNSLREFKIYVVPNFQDYSFYSSTKVGTAMIILNGTLTKKVLLN